MARAARGKAASGVDKPWRDALRLAANRPHDDGRKMLAHIAEKVVTAAADGDMAAAREVGDRLDGKAMQPIEHSGSIGANADELTDEQLAAIASGSGSRAAEASEGSSKLH